MNNFAPAIAQDGEDLKEVSWTRAVQIFSPNGGLLEQFYFAREL
jgi:hypothetical protein